MGRVVPSGGDHPGVVFDLDESGGALSRLTVILNNPFYHHSNNLGFVGINFLCLTEF